MTTSDCSKILRPDQTVVFAINRQVEPALRDFVYKGKTPSIINSLTQAPAFPVYNAISEFIKKGIQ